MKKKKEMKIEDLAIMVNKGFNGMSESMNKQFGEVKNRLDALENGQEEIKLRLTNVAYRFEADFVF